MYSPLDRVRKEIRLLQLCPGGWNDEIRCHLLLCFLPDKLDYKALSYVWGDPLDNRSITVNDEHTSIGRNLFEALQRIRDEESTIVIWVDGLCINQANTDERSQQVQLMQEIYSTANEVLVWLGYGTNIKALGTKPKTYRWAYSEADPTILKCYFNQDNIALREPDAIPGLREFVYLNLLANDKHLTEISDLIDHDWSAAMTAIAILLESPWFYRVWTLQEIVLARKATVIFGNSQVPWDVFAGVGNCLWKHRSSCCLEFSLQLSHRDGLILEKLGDVSDEFLYVSENRKQKTSLTLRDILQYSIWRNTTDPRDIVYGVLGLVTDWYNEEPLLPDYNQEVPDILMHAALKDIRGSQTLAVLMGVPSVLPYMPSWVKQASNSKRWRNVQGDRLVRMQTYSAAGTTSADVVQDGRALLVSGLTPTDTVAHVGPVMFGDSDSYDSSIAIIHAWQSICNESGRYDKDTFWRVLFGDLMKPYDSDGYEERIKPDASVIVAIQQDWWTWFQSESSTGGQDGMVAEFSTEDHYRINRIHQTFLVASTLRCFFITTGGRMGTGPPGLETGDQILILLGGTSPFCIRRHEEEDDSISGSLVGDVFVHGLMYGEGMPADWEAKVVKIRLTDDVPAAPPEPTRIDANRHQPFTFSGTSRRAS